jgi:hypothetical protein
MTFFGSRKLTSTLLASAVSAVIWVAAAPAHAVWNPAGGLTGYWGPWLGSYGTIACMQFTDHVVDAGPWVGRTGGYPSATQTIYLRSRLERLVNGRYELDVLPPWRSVATAPGQYAKFAREAFTIRIDGVYRVSYDFRWYVGGRQVGSALTYHHDSEFDINRMEGQRIVSNGCTMDV